MFLVLDSRQYDNIVSLLLFCFTAINHKMFKIYHNFFEKNILFYPRNETKQFILLWNVVLTDNHTSSSVRIIMMKETRKMMKKK